MSANFTVPELRSYVQSMSFFSVTKFVNFVNVYKLGENVKQAKVFYKGSHTFKNKFGQMCVKPIYIILYTDSQPVYINHEKILTEFSSQPVISFNTNKARRFPEGKYRYNMYCLTIDFKQQESKTADGESFSFYPIEIHKESNEKVVEKIESLRIKPIDDFVDTMADIVLDALV